MPSTSGSSLRLRNGQNTNISIIDFPDSGHNIIPPLPKKKLANRVLSKKSASRTRVSKENEHRPRSPAVVDSLQTDAVREQVGNESFQMTAIKVFCTDVPNHGYLTPADPPIYNESHARSIVPSNSPITNKTTPRLDSVNGFSSSQQPRNVDRSTPVPASPTSVLSVSRLSVQYDLPDEDMDHYNKIQDDQWNPSPGQQGQGQTPGVTDDSTHTYLQFSAKSSSDTIKERTSQSVANCWVVVSLTAILIVSMTALSLSIYQLASSSASTVSMQLYFSVCYII